MKIANDDIACNKRIVMQYAFMQATCDHSMPSSMGFDFRISFRSMGARLHKTEPKGPFGPASNPIGLLEKVNEHHAPPCR